MSSGATPVEHPPALSSATARLADEFRGTYGPETIERFLAHLLRRAPRECERHHVPAPARERFARQRLQALAKVEGHSSDGRPTVLFLCVHNAGRSQMALGFFQHLAGNAAVAWSGGSEPGAQINPVVVQVMKERGIDVSGEFPKPWTDETVRAADVVITMGCGDACPIFPGKHYEEWTLEDPAGQDFAAVRAIRDQVEDRVKKLLGSWTSPRAPPDTTPTDIWWN